MPLGFIAGAAALGVGVSAYNASQSAGLTSQAESEAATVSGEQQYYAQQLQQLIANPSSVTSLPGYQFNFNQGAAALTDQAAAMGYLGSGNLGTSLVQYGQNYATNAYQTQANLLASLSGLTSASSPSSLLSAASSSQASTAQQMSGLMNSLAMYGMLGYGQFGGAGGSSGGAISSGVTDTAGTTW